WHGSANVLAYFPEDDDNYLSPIVVMRHDRLHLEARWNYEEKETGSLFAGWVFTAGSTVEFEAVPMLGAIAGDLDGVAPGCTFSLAWKELFVYSENEIVFDLSDREGSYFYNWSEITWEPLDWLGAGMVTQHTRVYESDREIQRGAMARVTKGRFSSAVYWFNPGSTDDFIVVSAALDF
ncbi:MAG TPA: hypothetical protein VJV75_07405, partial [Candidatus Polarisedimenticolia bacterium]|nr:hypothetical protein [Candidatus Polarisedimenticolia bacterium]